MTGNRTYRSGFSVAAGSLFALAFVLLGISMIVLGHRYRAMNITLGAIIILASVGIAAALWTNSLSVNDEGISYRYNFKRSAVPWISIESFGIAPGPGMGPWSSLQINVRSSSELRVGSVTGTKEYVTRVASDLEAIRSRVMARQSKA
jgi:hypothetical protein